MIKDICDALEYIIKFLLEITNLEKPIVAKAALTGIAANNILGYTLHSMLYLNFGNDFTALGDDKRDHLRNLFSELQLLIIDEISMVKPDMLYQVISKLLKAVKVKKKVLIFLSHRST